MVDGLKEFAALALRRPWAAILGVVLLVGGPIAGYLLRDYQDFAKARREGIAGYYNDLKVNQEQLDPVILAFVAKAKSGQDVPSDMRAELTTKLIQVRTRAEQVAAALPETRAETNRLVDAMVEFNAAALKLNGPADARQFWEALGRLDDAKQALKTKVTSIQNSYFLRSDT